jgi:hypothetical protein
LLANAADADAAKFTKFIESGNFSVNFAVVEAPTAFGVHSRFKERDRT